MSSGMESSPRTLTISNRPLPVSIRSDDDSNSDWSPDNSPVVVTKSDNSSALENNTDLLMSQMSQVSQTSHLSYDELSEHNHTSCDTSDAGNSDDFDSLDILDIPDIPDSPMSERLELPELPDFPCDDQEDDLLNVNNERNDAVMMDDEYKLFESADLTADYHFFIEQTAQFEKMKKTFAPLKIDTDNADDIEFISDTSSINTVAPDTPRHSWFDNKISSIRMNNWIQDIVIPDLQLPIDPPTLERVRPVIYSLLSNSPFSPFSVDTPNSMPELHSSKSSDETSDHTSQGEYESKFDESIENKYTFTFGIKNRELKRPQPVITSDHKHHIDVKLTNNVEQQNIGLVRSKIYTDYLREVEYLQRPKLPENFDDIFRIANNVEGKFRNNVLTMPELKRQICDNCESIGDISDIFGDITSNMSDLKTKDYVLTHSNMTRNKFGDVKPINLPTNILSDSIYENHRLELDIDANNTLYIKNVPTTDGSSLLDEEEEKFLPCDTKQIQSLGEDYDDGFQNNAYRNGMLETLIKYANIRIRIPKHINFEINNKGDYVRSGGERTLCARAKNANTSPNKYNWFHSRYDVNVEDNFVALHALVHEYNLDSYLILISAQEFSDDIDQPFVMLKYLGGKLNAVLYSTEMEWISESVEVTIHLENDDFKRTGSHRLGYDTFRIGSLDIKERDLRKYDRIKQLYTEISDLTPIDDVSPDHNIIPPVAPELDVNEWNKFTQQLHRDCIGQTSSNVLPNISKENVQTPIQTPIKSPSNTDFTEIKNALQQIAASLAVNDGKKKFVFMFYSE